MKTTVETSGLINERKDKIVPERMKVMERAILEKDFQTFATETMKDSNQFHAVCLDTYPPIFYLNDISNRIIQLITKYNAAVKENRVAYTFDAGPNAVLYTLPQYHDEVHALIQFYFPIGQEKLKGTSIPDSLNNLMEPQPNVLDSVIVTKLGPGPMVLGESEKVSLIDFESGLPNKHTA